MDRDQFASLVREALTHLYDRPSLEAHPLGELLVASGDPGSVDFLQQVLFEAIQQLKPTRNSPQYLPRLRRYEHIRLRYLEGLSPTVIGERLCIGERQVRRDHQEAVDAVVSILWSRYNRLRWSQAPRNSSDPPARTTDELLDSEARRIATSPISGPISLKEVVDGVIATLGRLTENRNVDIQAALPDSLPPTLVDRIVLRQILLSILTYSISSDRCERVTLTARDQGQRLMVTIRIRRSCATSEMRDESASRVVTNGPLAASARLVELQGGTLDQRGSGPDSEEFRLTLPCVPFSTVLVIDDNPDFVRLFQRFLADGPYRVIQAGVASEALGIARCTQPDLITLDVMMPTQDGWETLQALKEDPETRHIPVLVCSVLREPTLAQSLGATEFLAKPITRPALLAALERCAHLLSPEAR